MLPGVIKVAGNNQQVKQMKTALTILLMLLSWSVLAVEVEFQGTPRSRTSITNDHTVREVLDKKEAAKYSVSITREGDQYFWASRGNLPLIKTKSGAYTTYISSTGEGYIRVRDDQHIYVEHLTVEMTSVTYYGR